MLSVRVAALDALGAAGESARNVEPALAWLRADRPAATFAEHAARLRALGRSGRADQSQAVATYFEQLPLDAPVEAMLPIGQALGTLDPQAAARLFSTRLTNKSDAGLNISPEINLIGGLPRDAATPALLAAFERIEPYDEQLALRHGLRRCCRPAALTASLGEVLDPRSSPRAIEGDRGTPADQYSRVRPNPLISVGE